MPTMRISIHKINRSGWLLCIAWLLVQSGILATKGITTDMEGQVYINLANYLLQHGSYEAPKLFFYTIPIVLLATCIKTGLGYTGMVAIQLIVNAIATRCFYKMCLRLSSNSQVAWIATLLLIIFIPLQVWNSFLYTESLFISITVIFSYYLATSKLRPMALLGLAVGLLLVMLTRPFGLLFVAPAFLYVVKQTVNGRYAWAKRSAIIAASIVAVLVIINLLFKKGGGDFDVMKPFVEGHIICFMPSEAGNTSLQLAHTGQPLADLWYYIVHNPGHFLKLCGLRLLSFFNLGRPYYSTAHNLALYAAIIPIYIFAIIGLFKKGLAAGKFYLCALIVFYALAVTLQCDDYHSRFVMVLYPYILFFAAVGIVKLLPMLQRKR